MRVNEEINRDTLNYKNQVTMKYFYGIIHTYILQLVES